MVYGTNSTTHSELPEEAETFLQEYAALRTIHRDSSIDLVSQSTLLQDLAESVINNFAGEDDDITQIPVNNTDLLVH